MSVTENKPFRKEYLSGYTGHVPSKMDAFGMTSGDVNKAIIEQGGRSSIDSMPSPNDQNRIYSRIQMPKNKINPEIYGNWSKYAGNWIAGPTHEIKTQHVPGYTGHVKGLVSENLFSKSYAKVSANAISRRHPVGHEGTAKSRFASMQRSEYTPQNFRRFVESKETKPKRDYDDFAKFINESHSAKKDHLMNRTTRHENGWMTKNRFGTTVLDPMDSLRTQNSVQQNKIHLRRRTVGVDMPGKDIIKPRLLEGNLAQNMEFAGLSDGFKKVFASDKKDQKMIIPVVGYGGHRRGDRSQNFFGKSFRDQSIQSKALERQVRQSSVN